MKTYKLHLLRHGLTQGNIDGSYIGITDIPVAKEGHQELLELQAAYKYPSAERFYSSPLIRCRQTLEILYNEHSPVLVPALAEWDFGEFEGKTPEDLSGDERFAAWLGDSVKNAPPGGEAMTDFFARVNKGFSDIVYNMMRDGVRESVLCTHGGVIMSVLMAFGLPERGYFDWSCGNGRGYTVLITPSLFMRSEKVEVTGELPIGGHAREMRGSQTALFEKWGDSSI